MPLFKKNSSVNELTPADFNGKQIKNPVLKNKKGLILFAADWCHFCKDFSPIYEKVSDSLGQSFPLFFFDCEKYGDFASKKFNVSGFPTVMYIDRNGIPYKKYTGDRIESSIISDICKEAQVCKRM